jgi:predicted DNA-binding protein YlxM (UPF0122 family)
MKQKKMPDKKEMPEIWLRDFAEIKGCTRQTVYSAIKRGELNSLKKFNVTVILNDKLAQSWQAQENMKR